MKDINRILDTLMLLKKVDESLSHHDRHISRHTEMEIIQLVSGPCRTGRRVSTITPDIQPETLVSARQWAMQLVDSDHQYTAIEYCPNIVSIQADAFDCAYTVQPDVPPAIA